MFKKLKNSKKGFTLAELLIVVAIIGVLVAISIPIFTAQLEKAREATDVANLRAAYAEGTAEVLTQDDMATGWTKIYTSDGKLVAADSTDASKGIKGKATQTSWQSTNPELGWTTYAGKAESGAVIKVTYAPGTGSADGKVTVDFAK
ncbi:type IV pilin protein [Bilifractor sp. LCP19S3_H10]|uniref:type IV pilin protein n=1 Tax=Bilifractor sp. LCP19S3_H10 TaxID=3438736 RepID=UPI003F8FE503